MRATGEIRINTKQPTLPMVSGVLCLSLPKATMEQGTDVKSIPQTASRLASGDTTMLEQKAEKQDGAVND